MPRHRTRADRPTPAEGDQHTPGALTYSQRQYRARKARQKHVEQVEADAIAAAIAQDLPDVVASMREKFARQQDTQVTEDETAAHVEQVEEQPAKRRPGRPRKNPQKDGKNRTSETGTDSDSDTMAQSGVVNARNHSRNWHSGVAVPPGKAVGSVEIPDVLAPKYLAVFKAVHNLLSAGMTRDRVVEAVSQEFAGYLLTDEEIHEIVTRVHRRWVSNLAVDLPVAKAAQVERLMRDLVRMRAHNHPNYLAICAHETLVSKILGTQQAVRVEVSADVRVRQQILSVVANLSQEEQDRIIAEEMASPARIS